MPRPASRPATRQFSAAGSLPTTGPPHFRRKSSTAAVWSGSGCPASGSSRTSACGTAPSSRRPFGVEHDVLPAQYGEHRHSRPPQRGVEHTTRSPISTFGTCPLRSASWSGSRPRRSPTQHPGLLDLFGVGHDRAAVLLIAAGDNPERLTAEASFATLCGVSPVERSWRRTQRRRLDCGGNRQANAALFRIALTRLRADPRTRAYVEKRTSEG
ncbi:IS110 family transposase [Micromonospora sp. NBC_01655]|uniref:transposase n=1 Tax=Micromonospora sp. NBC_01655 TaxID=2975983 RepID=UPI0022593A75|nr:transposase [Micromonospora sp. NBC_01655]MCX4471386.1 IS110 family transposase [Micromonospora sp. NBC_01655]